MKSTVIQDWLRKKVAVESLAYLGLAVGSLFLGILVLAATCFFTYAFMWIGFNEGIDAISKLLFNKPIHVSHDALIIMAGIFVALLFWGNARTTQEYLGDLPEGNWVGHGTSHHCDNPEQFYVIRTAAKFITDMAYSGPRLIANFWTSLQKAFRLRKLDTETCAALLNVLLTQAGVVSREVLAGQFPGWDLEKIARQLKDIEGIIFLESGWMMTSDLKTELFQNHYATV